MECIYVRTKNNDEEITAMVYSNTIDIIQYPVQRNIRILHWSNAKLCAFKYLFEKFLWTCVETPSFLL